ncbi:hypothetical protein SAMN05518684_12212 [Salipaludibacillus aurantiacus]|uniref:Uncharacterized protein n=1 Tax=Salipaludibacillus aurantiacus TaxID=1601833 RepID=A0A1H9WZM4_9BACI|nr:hypothetical protein SAMN05518684_12212 [Salipaludibacillus aurantiacus]
MGKVQKAVIIVLLVGAAAVVVTYTILTILAIVYGAGG